MDKEKVLNLAKLARIEISESEAEKLSGDFESILGYVGEVKKVSGEIDSNFSPDDFPVRNVLREDSNPHESGIFTHDLLEQAPESEKGYVKVKKIL